MNCLSIEWKRNQLDLAIQYYLMAQSLNDTLLYAKRITPEEHKITKEKMQKSYNNNVVRIEKEYRDAT